MKRLFLLSFVLVVLFSAVSFAALPTRTFTHMTVHVPSGWTATETSSGYTLLLEDSTRNYAVMFALIQKGNDSLYDLATEYYYEYGDGNGLEGGGGTFYSFYSDTYNPDGSSWVLLDDHDTRSIVPSGYCLIQSVTKNLLTESTSTQATWRNIRNSLAININGGGGGGGGGGCNAGFGILSLFVIGFAFKKK